MSKDKEKEKFYPIPHCDPVTGGPLFISELTGENSGVKISGKFEIPNYAKLPPEQAAFLETFLRCRGMLNGVERELNLSYPTVRSRLDDVLASLGFAPIPETPRSEKADKNSNKVLQQLERGEITAEEAKEKLRKQRGTA